MPEETSPIKKAAEGSQANADAKALVLAELSEARQIVLTDEQISAQLALHRTRQDLGFRPLLFRAVVGLMVAEVLLLFVVVFLQGFGSFLGRPFHLDQWVLTSINVGILAQTFGLAKIITKALFKEL